MFPQLFKTFCCAKSRKNSMPRPSFPMRSNGKRRIQYVQEFPQAVIIGYAKWTMGYRSGVLFIVQWHAGRKMPGSLSWHLKAYMTDRQAEYPVHAHLFSLFVKAINSQQRSSRMQLQACYKHRQQNLREHYTFLVDFARSTKNFYIKYKPPASRNFSKISDENLLIYFIWPNRTFHSNMFKNIGDKKSEATIWTWNVKWDVIAWQEAPPA